MISVFVSLIFIVYALLVVVLIAGWHRATHQRQATALTDLPLVSIVIPVRNEESNIGLLLNNILGQSYQHIEIIVVDDHSQDSTVKCVEKEMHRDKRITLLKSEGAGKKEAITTAIKSAQGSIILTTDADCRVDQNWIACLLPYFSNDEAKLVFGGVKITGYSFLDDVQAIEFASLIGTGGATSALGFPTMCNGANLAFRRDVFNEVGGYSGNLEIPSGDDEFLMRKIKAKYPSGIEFAGVSEVVVSTSPSKDLNEFIQQRIRWAGKWKHNQSLASILLAFFIFLFQVLTMALPILIAVHQIDWQIGAFIFITKVLAEYIFLQQVCSFLSIPWSWMSFILLQALYPFYVVAIGLLSNFLSFSWRGRVLKSFTVKE